MLRPAVARSEATIVAPVRRTPAPVPVQAPPPTPAVPEVAKAPTKPSAAPLKAPAKKVDRPNVFAPAVQAVSSAVQAIGPAMRGVKRNALLLWGGVGVAALAVVGVGVFLPTRGPVPTGVAVIDAVPWATVTAIQNEDGEPQSLPSPASTPFALTLPAGTYQITLTGPPPESKTETVSVRIDVGATSVVPATRFQAVTVEEYFELYPVAGEGPPRRLFRHLPRRRRPRPHLRRPELRNDSHAACPARRHVCVRRSFAGDGAGRGIQAGAAGPRRQEMAGRRPPHAERPEVRQPGVHAQSASGLLGVQGTEYLPHYFLGEAYYYLQDCGGAVSEWSDLRAAVRTQDQA